MIQHKKMKLIRSILVAIVVILFIVSGIAFYNSQLRTMLSQSTDNTLEEIMQQQAFNFASKIDSEIKALQNFSDIIAISDQVHDISLETLQSLAKKTSFEYITIVDKNGDAINNEDKKTNVLDRNYFHQALAGETVLTEPVKSKVRDAMIIVLATPIHYQGEIIGVLLGSYDVHELDKLFISSFGDMGYAYVTTNDGKIIARTKNSKSITTDDNYFSTLEKAEFYGGDSFESIKIKVSNNESGQAKYNYFGQKRLVHYCTIGVNDWNLFSIVPDEVISETANKITFGSAMLSLLFVVIFVGMIFWNLMIQRDNLKKISTIAFVDELTGVPTLAKFKIDAQLLLKENPETTFLLVKCDIDRFKLINQTLGYDEGDRVIQNVAESIKQNLQSEREIFARINIDEFIILHEYVPTPEFSNLRDTFHHRFYELMGSDFKYKVRFPSGYCFVEGGQPNRDIYSVIEKVNIAHRKAKRTGEDVCVYDEAMTQEALREKDIENRMEDALKHKEFQVFLQPKYELINETIAGAEALVRWKEGDKDIVYPGDFIPLFEQNGFITKLDFYMFENTCEIIKGWIQAGLSPVLVSVNFSRLHLNSVDFVAQLCAITDLYGVPRNLLEVELTESTMFDNEEVLIGVLEQLHEAGFTLSMDDFGTGYSSLGLLKNLPVDVIKIDRGFFTTATDTKRARAVISNIMKMAKEIGIITVAEGVETKENIDLLRELGCDIVQGYYYAKPMPQDQFTQKLSRA